MEQKTISINPNLFNINNSKSKKKLSKKELPLKIQKPTNLKRELIKKIKTYQNKTRKNKKYSFDDRFNSEFRDSIEYLRNVMDEKNIDEQPSLPQINTASSRPISTTPLPSLSQTPKLVPPVISQRQTISQPVNTSQHVNNDVIKDDLPWGILKNGSKPTYRNWIRNQTLKQKKEHNPSLTDNYVSKQNNDIEELKIEKREPRKIKKKITRKKYSCGKSKTKKQIGILIKGIESKNKVLKEHRNLKQESIQNIKNYLYKKSFIKVGTTAPDKILRDMYESLILTGDIHNKNSHIMIHNYMSENT